MKNRFRIGILLAASAMLLHGTAVSGKEVSPVNITTQDFALNLNESDTGVMPRGVSFEGISLEGKTYEEAKALIDDYVAQRYERYIRLIFGTGYYEYSGASFETTWQNPDVVEQLRGQELTGNFIEQYKKQKDLDENPLDLDLVFAVNEDLIRQTIAGYVAALTTEPVNATVRREGDQFIVTESRDGYAFDEAAIDEELIGLITDFSDASEILYEVPCVMTPAQYNSSFFAFSPQPLGSYTTYELGGESRRNNIVISATNMNGHMFYPGEVISTNAMYGSVSEAGGYSLAASYEEGNVVESIGGGICQTTTTLYNAVLRAELGVVKRSHHSMMVKYVPPAMDATVYPADGLDFIFQNTTDHPIYIESYVNGDSVSVNIWGVEYRDPARTITFDYAVDSVIWPDPLYNIVVNDEECRVGIAYVSEKHTPDTDPHPAVHAISYKNEYYNGELVNRIQLNNDTYKAAPGLLYRASDCMVIPSVEQNDSENANFHFIHFSVNLLITDLAGNPWPSPESVYASMEAASREAEEAAAAAASKAAEEEWLRQQGITPDQPPQEEAPAETPQ